MGKCARPEDVRRVLEGESFKAVTVIHVETSTGVVNPIRGIGRVVREYGGVFYVVDACSLGV